MGNRENFGSLTKSSASGTPEVEYHADDYGLFPAQGRRILDCSDHGVLNAISIMANSPYLPECMEMLRSYQDRLKITLHLNFMEGRAFFPGLLTNAEGVFQISFGTLLLHSFLPDRGKYRAALRDEIRAQIFALLPYLEEKRPLRIDGHAHYHMLPMVFDALMDVIQEEQLPVSYIRIPRESIGLYLRHRRELEGFQPINLVKVLILNLLARRNCRKYKASLKQLEQRVFLGVMFSGRMSFQNVSALLPEAKALALKKGWGVEVLAHPGGVYEEADVTELTHGDDVKFLTSEFRQTESEMFSKLLKMGTIA